MTNEKHERIAGRLSRDYIELADLVYIKDLKKALRAKLRHIKHIRKRLKTHN